MPDAPNANGDNGLPVVATNKMTDEFFVERSATLKKPESGAQSRRLSDWENLDAYVLLGEPGSGKTTDFRTEARRMGDTAYYVTVRDFAAP